MDRVLLIGVGGFIGSVFRYWVSGYVQEAARNAFFPYGTLAVNVIGCLIIGFLSELAESHGVFTAESRALVFVGLLGGFTTFSTFSNETMNLLRDGENLTALMNAGLHLVLGVGAVWAGRALASLIWR
ncbi:MAG: fluoride efflux transporter CrcB [Acidobacteriota bacterium]